ncbi:MAG: outer membrane beta-barrel protein [Hyphomicrobium sp.]
MSRLAGTVSAIALSLMISAPRARAIDVNLKGVEGLNLETVANKERQKNWDNSEQFGAGTVESINRRELSPDGLRYRNYVVVPTVGAAVVYDDNIFATDLEKRGDLRTELTPSVQFRSELPRHSLDFSLDGKIVTYLENEDQNYENIRARADGALHFDHAHTLSAGVSSMLENEERDDPSFPNAARGPIPVFKNRAAVGITRDVGRLYGTVAFSAERRDYWDVDAVDGSNLDQDTRDTDTFATQLKMAYRFSPGFEGIAKVRASRAENRGDAFVDRDATGYEAVAGVMFETNPLLRWRILGGFGVQDFKDAAFQDIATSIFEADVQWLPTQRLTIYAALTRQIREAAGISDSGLVEMGAEIRADYEIYHNLVLSGALEVRNDEFQGITREDRIYAARLGLDYYFTKNWLFTFGYEHQVRDSTDDSLDMHRNRFRVGAKLRF